VRQRAALGAAVTWGTGARPGCSLDLPLRRERDPGYWHSGYAEGALAGVQWGGQGGGARVARPERRWGGGR